MSQRFAQENIHLLMHPRISGIQDGVVGEPGRGGLGEPDVGHMDAEVLAGVDRDVADAAQVHARLVRLLFDGDHRRRPAGVGATHVVHGDHAELELVALLQVRHLNKRKQISAISYILTYDSPKYFR